MASSLSIKQRLRRKIDFSRAFIVQRHLLLNGEELAVGTIFKAKDMPHVREITLKQLFSLRKIKNYYGRLKPRQVMQRKENENKSSIVWN